MWLPHTVTVEAPSDGGAGTGGGGIEYGTPVEITANVQPQTILEVEEAFGIGVDANYAMFASLDHSPLFVTHARVKKGSQVFFVATRPKVYDQGLPTDHVLVALKEAQFAATS